MKPVEVDALSRMSDSFDRMCLRIDPASSLPNDC